MNSPSYPITPHQASFLARLNGRRGVAWRLERWAGMVGIIYQNATTAKQR